MSVSLKQAVLVSVGRNPVSQVCRASQNDSVAMALGRHLGGTQDVIHAGNPDEPALLEYLAYGAQTLNVLPVPEMAEISSLLAAALKGYDLILCGDRAESGQGSGLLPYLLAKALDLPVISAVLDIKLAEGMLDVVQGLPKGRRRNVRLPMPAIIAVHPQADYRPAYIYAKQRSGRILSQSASTVPSQKEAWVTSPAGRRLVKLAPAETRQGHARMLSAITLESAAGTVLADGSPADKAAAIMAYLRHNRLINS